jgi:hypothetical protein
MTDIPALAVNMPHTWHVIHDSEFGAAVAIWLSITPEPNGITSWMLTLDALIAAARPQ